jgi:hypothetical protein
MVLADDWNDGKAFDCGGMVLADDWNVENVFDGCWTSCVDGMVGWLMKLSDDDDDDDEEIADDG